MKTVRKNPEKTLAGKPAKPERQTSVVPGVSLSGIGSKLDVDVVGLNSPGVIWHEPGQAAGGVPLPGSGLHGNAMAATGVMGSAAAGSTAHDYDVQIAQHGRSVDLALTVPVPERAQRLGLDVGQAVNQWAQMLPLFIENSVKGQEAALQRAALAYQPQPQLRPVDLELLEMQKNAAEAILSGTRWLTAAEVAQEAGRPASNPHALANRWKKEGKLFAIRYQGVERYPRYAFDEHMAPRPVIAEVIRRFAADAGDGELDAWDIAAWFESANTYLDSSRPRERLDAPDVIAFALEHMNNWMHG